MLCIHSFSAYYKALGMENNIKSISTINPVIMEKSIIKAYPSYQFKSGCFAWSWCIATLRFKLFQTL